MEIDGSYIDGWNTNRLEREKYRHIDRDWYIKKGDRQMIDR